MIKSFREFISDDRNPFLFERFISKIDVEINDIIWESLGVSWEVENISNQLIEHINRVLEDGEYEKINGVDIDFIDDENVLKSDLYEFSQVFSINDLIYDVDCRIMNYTNIDDDTFKEISTLNVEAFTTNLSSNRFKIDCYIPTINFKMCERGISVLKHELMHSWQHHNKNINKREKENSNWKNAYVKAVSSIRKKCDDDILLISKSIYYGDLRELCAFTQQAYYELESVSNIDDVHKEIRKLDVYKGLQSVKSGIDYLKNNELPDIFKISKKTLLDILNRRYDKYKRNIARLILMRKEELEKNMSYIDISKEELMLMR